MSPTQLHTDQLASQVKALRALARVLVRGSADAEDLLQDTLVVALQSAPAETEGLGAWLRGVMRHKAQHSRRSQSARVHRERQGARTEALPATDDLVARKAQLATLVDEVLRLKEPYQTVLYLRYFEDKGPREIALELDIPEGTVASQVHRGLELLRSRLDNRADGDRSAWVGALQPWFSGEAASFGSSWGGYWMAGTLKLVGAAALVAAVLYVAWNRDVMPGESSLALVPDTGGVSEGTGTREELEPFIERQVIEPEQPVVLAPKTAAPKPIANSAPPVSKHAAVSQPESSVVPVEVVPPVQPNFGWEGLTITRRHMFDFDVASANIEINAEGAPAYPLELGWHYGQGVYASDSLSWLAGDTWPTVLRTMDPAGSLGVTEDLRALLGLEGQEHDSSSSLNGRVIRFLYDERGQSFSAQIQQEEDPKRWDAIAGLEEDMDLRALRPPVEVVEGQEWEVPCVELLGLFRPGGDLQLSFEGEADSGALGVLSTGPFDAGSLGRILEGLDPQDGPGAWTVTAGGLTTEDGRELRSLRISINLERSMEWQEFWGEGTWEEADGFAPLASALESTKVDVTMELAGTATWDQGGNRVAALDLEGSVETSMHIEVEGAPSAEISMEFLLVIDVENESEFSVK